MAFRINSFAGVSLPGHNWSLDLSTPKTNNPIVPTLGGPYDIYGVRRRIQHDQMFDIAGILDSSTLQADIRALKGQVGRTGYLVRTHVDGSNSLQRYCRLLHVGYPVRSDQRGYINTLSCIFWTNDPFWRSQSSILPSFPGLVAGANTCLFTILGEEDVLDAIVTVTATSNISSITINHSKVENGVTIVSNLRYTSTLTTGNSLVLDCGAYTAKVAGVGVYSGFAEGSTHTENYWLRLPAVASTITVTLGSGTGAMSISYFPQYQ